MIRKLLVPAFLLAAFTGCQATDYSSDGTAGNNSTVTGQPDSANAGAVYFDKNKQYQDTVTHPQNMPDTAKVHAVTTLGSRP